MQIEAHLQKSRAARLRFGPSWPNIETLGAPAPYIKDFDWPGDALSPFHRMLRDAPLGRSGVEFNIDIGIDGYLQRGDALKLYELAYLAPGDALDIGTHFGLSAFIIAQAQQDRGFGYVETIDIDAATTKCAEQNLSSRACRSRIRFHVGDAADRLDAHRQASRKFGFVFVDHWHGYDVTRETLVRCADLLRPGGYVQIHDFSCPENRDPAHVYGVFQAALDTVCENPHFSWRGGAGCTGVFQFDCDSEAARAFA